MKPTLLLFVAFLCLGGVYNAVVPLGEGPDEGGHMAYVLFLAREGRLPVQRAAPAADDLPGEGHQPPLAYLLALPAVAWLPPAALQIDLRDNPRFVWHGGSEPAAFVRASREYWPWQGVTLAWHMARGVSTLLGLLTLFCVWRAAHVFFPAHSRVPLLATALIALNPQFLFTSALVTNDVLLVALSAALFWVCVAASGMCQTPAVAGAGQNAVRRRNRNWSVFRWSILSGVLLGLALLTKQSALLFVPLLLWASWRLSDGRWRSYLISVGSWTGMAFLVAGWWYLRNWRLYDDPLGLRFFRARFLTEPFDWQSVAAWAGALEQLHASFWARFGWLTVYPPAWVLGVYTLLELIALVGLVSVILHAWHRLHLAPLRFLASPWFAPVLLPLLALGWLVSFALTVGLVAWQGRLLFPALPALALLLALGLQQVSSDLQSLVRTSAVSDMALRLRAGVWAVVPVVLLALALYLPFGVIRPAYTWYTLPAARALDRIETPTAARFARPWERGVMLRGWRLDGVPRPGQTITVTLIWQALEPVPRDWTVFVHLVDANGSIVAEDNRRPRDGDFPMPLWAAGDWVADPHPLTLPPDLPSGTYTLRVGLYLPDNRGERQYIRTDTGEPINDFVVLDQVIPVPSDE